jgi:drug/metabolite transporter (DMT)-like permease
VCTAVACVVFFPLVAEVGPGATLTTYVNPAVVMLLGVSVLGERFGFGTAAGFVLIVIGCLLATARGTLATAEESAPPGPDGGRDIAGQGAESR